MSRRIALRRVVQIVGVAYPGLVAGLALAAGVGCVVDLNVNEKAGVRCSRGSDCPEGWTCDAAQGRCYQAQNLLADTDADGVADAFDICPSGNDGLDRDLDGVPDDCDTCPFGDDAVDTDADEVPDACDACPGERDADDVDQDGLPDACDICSLGLNSLDVDADGVPNACDICPGAPDDVDTDSDGVPDGCDLCPGVDNNAPPSDDPIEAPDVPIVDTNCDGVDGVASATIFVSSLGDDNLGDGSLLAPLASLSAGLAAAAIFTPPKVVVVASGVYNEPDPVRIPPGARVYGLFSVDFRQRRLANKTLLLSQSRIGMTADGVVDTFVDPTLIDGLTVLTTFASGSARSSIAVWVRGIDAPLTLRHMVFEPGTGARQAVRGRDGDDGAAGNPGLIGVSQTVVEDPAFAAGVSGGAGGSGFPVSAPGYCAAEPGAGGNGGRGGDSFTNTNRNQGGQSGASGGAGAPAGGALGTSSNTCAGNAYPGSGGAPDPSPAGANAAATADQAFGELFDGDRDWRAKAGLAGDDGVGGSGGGGGQGGAGVNNFQYGGGAGGGGGGQGGCGAEGGIAGMGGGGSIGILAIDAPGLEILSSVLAPSAGGDGGAAGDGGIGGAGGAVSARAVGPEAGCGWGGLGGRGGDGGHGGGGGGGAGGGSFGILCSGADAPCTQATDVNANNTFEMAAEPAVGGAGGSNGTADATTDGELGLVLEAAVMP